ncbi:ribonuclease HI [Lachnospiraceae bacterium NE2001]|nr:ribonuclease HI [Lachnospiraceae bacterium NE2001]
MADKKNYYAVKKGVNPGIYETWAECQANVHGFSGAIFKGFKTLAEAEEFMGGVIDSNKDSTSSRQVKVRAQKQVTQVKSSVLFDSDDIKYYMESLRESEAVAFVDGSYNISTKVYAYGMVLLAGDDLVEQCEAYSDEEMAAMRNVAGEVEGSRHAMQYCLDHGIASIDIFYDYEGIEKWALGLWKTNKEGTRAYKAFYDSIKDRLEVNFHKVKGHSGDMGNERADQLAKSAAGVE